RPAAAGPTRAAGARVGRRRGSQSALRLGAGRGASGTARAARPAGRGLTGNGRTTAARSALAAVPVLGFSRRTAPSGQAGTTPAGRAHQYGRLIPAAES